MALHHTDHTVGEKRRTSIGIQLLQNPSILFADEPTTGLDAASAHHVIKTLKNLAKRGRTIIITIHQPRSEIWDLFDNVMILAQGSCIYTGATKDCTKYFDRLGHRTPPFVNPAEFLIDLIAIDHRSTEREMVSLDRLSALKRSWVTYERTYAPALKETFDLDSPQIRPIETASVWQQFITLTRRTFLITLRDPMGIVALFVEAVLIAIMLGLIFYKMDGSLKGIRSRAGAFYSLVALQGYQILMFECYRLSFDLRVFDRERTEGVVSVIAYLASRRAAKLMEDLMVRISLSRVAEC